MRPDHARGLAAAQPHLNAFVRLCTDGGDEGFAVAVKDIIDVAGVPTTAGTSALPAPVPDRDAPVVAAIRAAGGGIVGKANLHEWAIGLTSVNPSFGRVGNPRFPDLIAGGSSGGSAAAVAAGMCDWALGTDTGGSIRVPAAACGVVGFKPTYGLLSNDGVLPVSESLDTVGPLGSSVAAVHQAIRVLAGPAAQPAHRPGFTLVRPPRGWCGELDPGIERVWAPLAADLDEVELPDRDGLTAASWAVLAFEAHRFHRERLERTPWVFSPDVRAVLDAGAELDRARYERALDRLAADAAACDEALGPDGVLLVPATASAVPTVESVASREPLTRFTRPFNGTGQPTVCLPVPADGRPVGMQLVAPRGTDHWLLDAAETVESTWAAAR